MRSPNHRRLRSRCALLWSGGLAALAVAGSLGATGAAHAAPADPHPAADGWIRTHGEWVRIQPGRPHAALDARAALGAAPRPQPSRKAVVNNDQPDLVYRGGQDSVGVTSGPPKVYLVYWGSQWGTAGKGADGSTTLSRDPDRAAPYQQAFFQGLGTGADAGPHSWSGVLTQYFENVGAGATGCPADAAHVGVPHGDALAGVWVDNAAPSPQAATEPQIAAEAAAAAKHFGNTTDARNRNVQYVVTTAQGVDPDHWHEMNSWCAWHTFERSDYGALAYTLMPYLTDDKYCGTNWINPGPRGRLDGWSLLGGHEYAETVTDQNAMGGWIDPAGQEDGDKCAWITEGTPGGLFDLDLRTGAFAVQTTWSNDQHTCSGDHRVVVNKPLVVSTLCDRTAVAGQPVSVPVLATDRLARPALRYTASGLPSGLAIDRATGVIRGRPGLSGAAPGAHGGVHDVTVMVRDRGGQTASARFRLTVRRTGDPGCVGIEQAVDPGFEVPTDAKGAYPGWWTQSAPGIITRSTAQAAHSGHGYAWLGHSASADDTLSQGIETTPGYTHASFSFWLHVSSANASAASADPQQVDTLTLELDDQYSGRRIAVLHTWTTLDATRGYVPVSFDLTPLVAAEFGSTVIVKFTAHESADARTAFLVDDTSFALN